MFTPARAEPDSRERSENPGRHGPAWTARQFADPYDVMLNVRVKHLAYPIVN